jgi:hypothetical protein
MKDREIVNPESGARAVSVSTSIWRLVGRLEKERNRHTESSKSHSLSVSLRNPHSMLNTSERIAAVDGVSCTPDRSTERGFVDDAR